MLYEVEPKARDSPLERLGSAGGAKPGVIEALGSWEGVWGGFQQGRRGGVSEVVPDPELMGNGQTVAPHVFGAREGSLVCSLRC